MLIFGFALYLQHVHASRSYRDAVDFWGVNILLDVGILKYSLSTLIYIILR